MINPTVWVVIKTYNFLFYNPSYYNICRKMVLEKITIAGIITAFGVVLMLYVGSLAISEVAEVVIENPKPFIDAGETLIETAPKILDAVNTMCKVDEIFVNAIDESMLRNVPEDAREILLLLQNGTEIDTCQVKILEEGLTAMQKNRINFKTLGCNIADCLN